MRDVLWSHCKSVPVQQGAVQRMAPEVFGIWENVCTLPVIPAVVMKLHGRAFPPQMAYRLLLVRESFLETAFGRADAQWKEGRVTKCLFGFEYEGLYIECKTMEHSCLWSFVEKKKVEQWRAHNQLPLCKEELEDWMGQVGGQYERHGQSLCRFFEFLYSAILHASVKMDGTEEAADSRLRQIEWESVSHLEGAQEYRSLMERHLIAQEVRSVGGVPLKRAHL